MASTNVRVKMFQLLALVCLAFLGLVTPVDGFWRLLCHQQLGFARMDPIVNPGAISPHAHVVAGSPGFGFNATAEDLMDANCTSCQITQDRSAYWTPALYFQFENGSYQLVPQSGGMTIYYYNDNAPGENLTAFPPGFRMIAGNVDLRSYPYQMPPPPMSNWNATELTQPALAAKSIGFNCLNYTPGFDTEGSLVYQYIREKSFLDANCLDGLRFELQFPSCWNGQDLDSEDHRSHILYPPQLKTGPCPPGFGTRTPVLFYETIWYTYQFVNYSGQFVIANGDSVGFGYHGDFQAGWNASFLQDAINTCTNASGLEADCPLFDVQDPAPAYCTMQIPEVLQDEDYHGPMEAMPGNVPIQYGPCYNLSAGPSCSVTGPALASKLSATPILDGAVAPSNYTMGSALATTSCNSVAAAAPTSTAGTANSTASNIGADVGGASIVTVEEIVTVTITEFTTASSVRPTKRHVHMHAAGNGHF